jgi:hypothetical protein
MQERRKFDVSFGEGYLYLRPLGSHNWAFNRYMIDMVIIFSPLPLVLKTRVGTSGDGVYSSESWEIGGLLGRFLALWWMWVAWLHFWLGCFRGCSGICYLQRCKRISDLTCMRVVVVWLVVLRKVSVVVGFVFWVGVEMLVRRLT